VIGAGTSGLITTKVFKEHGLAVDCLEKGSGIGGLWRFQNDNGMSTCYRSLHINTSKRVMQLSDFPFLDSTAEYPSHQEILAEFERYTDHFDLRKHIRFKTEVLSCDRESDGTWRVKTRTDAGIETRRYDFLAVANGHHWDPRRVEFPGAFDGVQMHSHHYVDVTDPHDLRDKNVVVVGTGNSAMDIACELGHTGQGAKKVFLAQRSGVWVFPKVFGNRPQDDFLRHPMEQPSLRERIMRETIPKSARLRFNDVWLKALVTFIVGNPTRVGLKEPKDPLYMRHPTISHEIHNRLIHGDIIPKGNIKELRGDRVEFEDGSVEDVDAIIYATGYNITFPFFEPDFISAPENRMPLFERIFDPRFDNLAFIALVQPLCAMMPIAELQSNLVADYLCGEYELPSASTMRQRSHAMDDEMAAQYTQSKSHTIQIDCAEYSYYLRKEWRAGAKRAERNGGRLPVPSRVDAEPAV
jgi:dimethylaniline monooxygenase (N-oxide forming)